MADVSGKSFWFTFPRPGDTRRDTAGPIQRRLLGSRPTETYLRGQWWAYHIPGRGIRVEDPRAWDADVRPGPPKRELQRAMQQQKSRGRGKNRARGGRS